MRIGILTYHDGINYGAFMQAYSLYTKLEELGHDVEIVNYKNFKHWFIEWAYFLLKGNILSNIKKILAFKKAQKLMKHSSFSFFSNSVLNKDYDAIVVGSDEVWNVHNCLFGFDSTYFSVEGSDFKWIAYAPSFGSTSALETFPLAACKGLERFSKIAVRDTNSQACVEKAIGENTPIVVDPTFLISSFGMEVFPQHSDYILVYAPRISQQEIQAAKEFAARENKKLIGVGYKYDWCDESVVEIGPFEWLGYFAKAEYVITSMFHGTIFSIKYNKQFCLIMDPYRTNKFTPMLDDFSLSDRVCTGCNLADILTQKINYDDVNFRIEKRVLESCDFLNKIAL